ncbi:MAG: YIP1 family protein [Candidatus Eisenbacteria bacterium]
MSSTRQRINNLGLVFTSPGVLARNIAEDPHWLIPLIIVLAVSFVAAFSTHRYAAEFERAGMEDFLKRSGSTDENIDDMFGSSLRNKVTAGASAAGLFGVVLLIAAALYKGVASIAGGKIGFRRMFALQTHAALIVTLGVLVRLPIILAKGSIDVRTGIAAFAPSVPLRSPLGTLLFQLDLFDIWSLVALSIGFSILAGLNIKKSAAIIFGLWAVFVALLVGLAVLRTRFMGGA